MLTRLVRVAAATEEGTDTRQRVSLSQLDATARSVIQSFVTARLLVLGRDEATTEETVEIAHEALIRTWPRLKDALNDDREFLLWRQRFGLMLSEWQRTGRDAGILLRGALLAEARRLVRHRTRDLNELEHEFIRSSETAAARPRRWATVVAAVAILFTLGLVGRAIWTSSDAYHVRAVVSEAQHLIGSSRVSRDWLSTLVLVGQPRQALEEAQKIENAEARSYSLAGVAEALVKTGAHEQALVVAQQIHSAYLRSDALADVLKAMGQTGGSKGIIDTAEKIEDAFSLSAALVMVADALIGAGKSEDAKPVANKAIEAASRIHDAYSRTQALTIAIRALARAGASEEAVEAVRRLEDAKGRAWALARVIALRAKPLRSEEAQIAPERFEYSVLRDAEAMARSGRSVAAFELAMRVDADRFDALASVIHARLQFDKNEDVKSISNDVIEAAQRVNAMYVWYATLYRRPRPWPRPAAARRHSSQR